MWHGARTPQGPTVAPGWLVVAAPGQYPGPVEHVVVGPGGVLAVAHWPGTIDVVDGVVHQDGRRRELQAADLVRETDRLAQLLRPEHRDVVAPVITVRGDRAPVKLAPGLVLLGADRLAWTLAGLDTHLGPDDTSDVVGRLAQARSRRADELPTQASLSAALLADRRRKVRA